MSDLTPIREKAIETIRQETIDRIAAVASRLLEARKAPNSQRAYASRVKQWELFCELLGAEPFPADPVLVVAWIAEMADTGKSVSTIRQSMAALRFAATQRGQQSPTDHEDVRRAVEGACRLYGRPRKAKRAIMLETLRRLLPTGSSERVTQVRAMLCLGWYGALRRSELVALRVGDVEVTEDGIVLHLARSKTDQSGRGVSRGIPYQSDSRVCPVRAVARWMVLRSRGKEEQQDAPFFRRISRRGGISLRGPSAQWVALVIKAHCLRAGLAPAEFGGHSLRRGFATEAARRGKRLEAIQHHLRHGSIATTQKYVEQGEMFSDANPATGMA